MGEKRGDRREEDRWVEIAWVRERCEEGGVVWEQAVVRVGCRCEEGVRRV